MNNVIRRTNIDFPYFTPLLSDVTVYLHKLIHSCDVLRHHNIISLAKLWRILNTFNIFNLFTNSQTYCLLMPLTILNQYSMINFGNFCPFCTQKMNYRSYHNLHACLQGCCHFVFHLHKDDISRWSSAASILYTNKMTIFPLYFAFLIIYDDFEVFI